MNIGTVILFSVLVFVTAAIYYDFRTFSIPNRLNAAGMVCGMTISFFYGGLGGLLDSAFVLIFVIVVLFPLFMARALGAGDIKLLSAIGTIVHMKVAYIIVIAFILASVWGVLFIGVRLMARADLRLTKIHMSLPIGIAAIVVLLIEM